MKVKLPTENEQFYINVGVFCGIDSYLITPKISAEWNLNNLFYRSLIVGIETQQVLSCGWPKFFNLGEASSLYPNPEEFKDWSIQEKLDGSLLIVDHVNGQFSMRTRGCFNYLQQDNSQDFTLLCTKYPKVVEFLKNNSHLTLLFEIVTPNNVIVIRPKEVEFYFLGAINKSCMQIVCQQNVLDIWRQIGCMPTPKTFQIEELKTTTDLANVIKHWKGQEGVVVCYNNNRNRIKLKSDWYLFCHRVKSQLNSEDNLIDYYIESELPDFKEFFEKIKTNFDFEIAVQLTDQIHKIVDAGILAKEYISKVMSVVHDIRNVKTRKEQAEMIKRNFSSNSSYAFTLLDNKPLTSLQWNKLIKEQIAK